MVELSDGRKGIVIENYGENNERLVIRLEDMSEINLCQKEYEAIPFTLRTK